MVFKLRRGLCAAVNIQTDGDQKRGGKGFINKLQKEISFL